MNPGDVAALAEHAAEDGRTTLPPCGHDDAALVALVDAARDAVRVLARARNAGTTEGERLAAAVLAENLLREVLEPFDGVPA